MELCDGFVRLIDARGDILVGVCDWSAGLFSLLVGEIGGEGLVLRVICGIFEFGECRGGNKFVERGDMVL